MSRLKDGGRNCHGKVGIASTPAVAVTISSIAVFCSCGCTQFGAISASGPITKRRSWARGWGKVSASVAITVCPTAIRSRSSVRGPLRSCLTRPNCCSTSCSTAKMSIAESDVWTTASTLRNSGCVGSGHAAERQGLDRVRICNPRCSSAASAASINSSLEAYELRKLLPAATMVALGNSAPPWNSSFVMGRILNLVFYCWRSIGTQPPDLRVT